MQEAERLPVASDFGRLLRHRRLAAGLSQEALAERARMSAFAISALERGHRRRPQLKTLELLADALHLNGEERARFHAAARCTQPPRNGAVTIGPWSDASTRPVNPNNLPRQVTSLVGRDEDLAKIAPLVRRHQVVTLVGPGGVGKTRLALRAGEALLEETGDGVWLVELGAFDEAASPVQTIASTFGLDDRGQCSLLDAVVKYLQSRRMVLIVDNCEHVIDEAARVIDALVRHAPNVSVLATSREPLAIAAEQIYRVPSLAVPPGSVESASEAGRYGAIELFVDRAKAAQSDFLLSDANAAVVSEICRRLDGIPLAIELASARTSVLSVSEIAEKLDQRFSILTSGRRTSIPRQQTLRALIDWSYDLLPQPEKHFFRMLGAFAGDFSIESAAALNGENGEEAAFEMLASLVEKSLVQSERIETKTRFRLLESVHAYAREHLAAHGELNAATSVHAGVYLRLAERLESEWDDTPDVVWRANAEPELENWRAVLRWAFAPGGEVDLGLRLIVALRPVWFTLAPAEGLAWVRAGLGACDHSQPNRIRAWLELSSAHLAMVTQQYPNAAASAQRALADFSALGEPKGTALARLFASAARGMLGERKEAQSDLRAALVECRALGVRRAVGAALIYLAALELDGGEAASARRLFAEALTLFKAIGASRPAAHVALNLAELEFKDGNPAEALRLAGEALEADGALNDRDAVVYDLCNIAAYEAALCRWDTCVLHARDALALARERRMPSAIAWAVQHLAAAAALRPASNSMLALEQRRRALCLVGFVDARIAEYGLHRDFTERREHEQILAAARDTLGMQTDSFIKEGAAWTESRAIEESLLV